MRLGAAQSQWKNACFPQFSWVFMPISSKHAGFWRFLAAFMRSAAQNQVGLDPWMSSQ
jgi:hypothetical protein